VAARRLPGRPAGALTASAAAGYVLMATTTGSVLNINEAYAFAIATDRRTVAIGGGWQGRVFYVAQPRQGHWVLFEDWIDEALLTPGLTLPDCGVD
jgi:hypothetical protein